MTDSNEVTVLCKSCGLCCTGHLFIWAKLRSAELIPAQSLGMHVFGSEPSQRGFSQPCPLWEGQCTIYTSLHYPHACRTYKCKLLKEILDESTTLPKALTVIQKAKEMTTELEGLLPDSSIHNFRERLVAHLVNLDDATARGDADREFRLKAGELLIYYKKYFGVKDLVDRPDEE